MPHPHISSMARALLHCRFKPLKIWNASRICVSSLRRGHANLLCIVPILIYAFCRNTPNSNYTSTAKSLSLATQPLLVVALKYWPFDPFHPYHAHSTRCLQQAPAGRDLSQQTVGSTASHILAAWQASCCIVASNC